MKTMEIQCFTSPSRENTAFWRQYSAVPTSGGKRPSNSEARHRSLYKTPPNWLHSYRNKCLNALSQRRQDRQAKLLDSFRKINLENSIEEGTNDCLDSKDAFIRQVMTSVWKECQFSVDYETIWNDYEHYLKDLEAELLQDDQNDYFDDLWDDVHQKELDWAVENQYAVTCFACQKNPLFLIQNANRTQIICQHCQFGFRVDFPVSSEHFCDRVDQIIDEHSVRCGRTFGFALLNNPTDNVRFTCKNCDFSANLFSGQV